MNENLFQFPKNSWLRVQDAATISLLIESQFNNILRCLQYYILIPNLKILYSSTTPKELRTKKGALVTAIRHAAISRSPTLDHLCQNPRTFILGSKKFIWRVTMCLVSECILHCLRTTCRYHALEIFCAFLAFDVLFFFIFLACKTITISNLSHQTISSCYVYTVISGSLKMIVQQLTK